MKKIVSMVAGLAVFAAFASEQPPVQVVSFSSQGTDTYADGKTAVFDGECYALVWSQDGTFDGIDAAGKPKDENDRVVYIGGLANNGKCSYVEFHVKNDFFSKGPSDEIIGGFFDLWVLDTRVFKGGEVVSWGKTENMIVTAASPASEASVQVKSGAAAPALIELAGGSSTSKSTVDNLVPPVITDVVQGENGITAIIVEKTVRGETIAIEGSNEATMENAKRGLITTCTGGPMTLLLEGFNYPFITTVALELK